jgi:preprotein translocase subunit YajC
MLIDPAFAQGAGPGAADTSFLFVLLAIMAVMYFIVLRPQQQRMKEHRAMVEKIRRGDTVVTSGGFIAKVTKVTENSDEIEVELSEGMKVRVLKGTLIDVRSKGEPVKEAT